MATGVGEIRKTVANGPYAYTWKGNEAQEDLSIVANNKSLVDSLTEVVQLARNMPGTIRSISLIVNSS